MKQISSPSIGFLDTRYLRLDASNDPVTGDFLIQPTADSTTVLQVNKADTTNVFNVDTTNSQVSVPRGSATTPPYSFTDDPNTGIYSPQADRISFAIGGAQVFLFSTTWFQPLVITYFEAVGGTTNIPGMSIRGDTNTGIGSSTADTLNFHAGNEKMRLISTGRLGINNIAPGAMLQIDSNAAATKGLIVKAAASQSANLHENQDSSGNVLSGADERGILFSDGNTVASNLIIGNNTGNTTMTGANNTALGDASFQANTTGAGNVAIGRRALQSSTEGGNSIAIGTLTLNKVTTVGNHVAIGVQALQNCVASEVNLAVGASALRETTSGGDNMGFGPNTGIYNQTGSRNILIGSTAGRGVEGNSYSNNVFIGYEAGWGITTGSDNIFIGHKAGRTQVTDGSDLLYIHNDDGLPLILGNFTDGSMKVEIADQGDLGTESLAEGDFATHAKWDATNDIDDTGGNAEYTFSANQTSTLTQTAANLAVAGVADSWYKFVYTVAVTTAPDGDLAATITTAFAATAQTLKVTAGTHTLYFKSAAAPTDFVISIVSGDDTEGQFSFDDLGLKQIVGGDFRVNGTFHSGDGANYAEIDNVGDVTFVGGGGLQFGEIWYHGAGFATTCTDAGTFYQVLGFDTDGEANGGVTPDHSNDHITVAKAGRYLISFSVSCRSAQADEYEFMVCYNDGPINGTACQNIMAHRDTSVAAAMGVVACTGICDLPVNATVELWVNNVDTGGRDIDIEHIVLNVTQIGGTT